MANVCFATLTQTQVTKAKGIPLVRRIPFVFHVAPAAPSGGTFVSQSSPHSADSPAAGSLYPHGWPLAVAALEDRCRTHLLYGSYKNIQQLEISYAN